MALVWQYRERSGYESWKGLSWGMHSISAKTTSNTPFELVNMNAIMATKAIYSQKKLISVRSEHTIGASSEPSK
ncbi:ycf49-like protein [Senna tora]|uniref:Ycf49-like protein n=1 Tax=Senna tora TaxID=362788 RepID=A0A834SPN1_9FABA|nr:ycf49-like protein [Senna tora]